MTNNKPAGALGMIDTPVWSNEEWAGFLPEALRNNDPRSAVEQLDAWYQHGGGWRDFEGFELLDNDSIAYPGDEPLRPLAATYLRDEHILLYPGSWVAVVQPDRSFRISRMD
jgi:hypothetical protein